METANEVFVLYLSSMTRTFLRRWALGSIAAGIVFIVARGVAFDSMYAACIIALLVGLINAFLPYLISMMSYTQSVLTLGLATLIANALALNILQQAGLGIHFVSFDAMVLTATMISVIAWFSSLAIDMPTH